MGEMQLEIKGFPLIKFKSKDRIQTLREGKLYMKSLEFYRKQEIIHGDCTVGDKFEAMAHINEGQIVIPELGVNKNISDELIKTSFSDSFVFCMFGISTLSEKFTFSDEQKKKIREFGDTALLITDSNEFLNRINNAVIRDKLIGSHGFVQYYDEGVDSADFWCSLIKAGMNNIAFRKRKCYAYQQEYRWLIEHPPTQNDFYELDIGNISDISVVFETEQILNALAKQI